MSEELKVSPPEAAAGKERLTEAAAEQALKRCVQEIIRQFGYDGGNAGEHELRKFAAELRGIWTRPAAQGEGEQRTTKDFAKVIERQLDADPELKVAVERERVAIHNEQDAYAEYEAAVKRAANDDDQIMHATTPEVERIALHAWDALTQSREECERLRKELEAVKERAVQALMVMTSDQQKQLHNQRYVDEVAEVANKVFSLDGCCHWETVCEAIEKLNSECERLRGELAISESSRQAMVAATAEAIDKGDVPRLVTIMEAWHGRWHEAVSDLENRIAELTEQQRDKIAEATHELYCELDEAANKLMDNPGKSTGCQVASEWIWKFLNEVAPKWKRENQKLRTLAEVAKKFEWDAPMYYSNGESEKHCACPSCGNCEGEGHAVDCELAAALAELTERLGGKS